MVTLILTCPPRKYDIKEVVRQSENHLSSQIHITIISRQSELSKLWPPMPTLLRHDWPIRPLRNPRNRNIQSRRSPVAMPSPRRFPARTFPAPDILQQHLCRAVCHSFSPDTTHFTYPQWTPSHYQSVRPLFPPVPQAYKPSTVMLTGRSG